jgi:outer membrane protein assembly factor BamB
VTRPSRRIPTRWPRLYPLTCMFLLGALLLLSACDLSPPPHPAPGSLRWRVHMTDTQRATPVFVANGLVYPAGSDHVIYALDAATDEQRWRTQLGVAAAFV